VTDGAALQLAEDARRRVLHLAFVVGWYASRRWVELEELARMVWLQWRGSGERRYRFRLDMEGRRGLYVNWTLSDEEAKETTPERYLRDRLQGLEDLFREVVQSEEVSDCERVLDVIRCGTWRAARLVFADGEWREFI